MRAEGLRALTSRGLLQKRFIQLKTAIGDGFRAMFPALMMLAAGFFFLFNGAGKLSVDELLQAKRNNNGEAPGRAYRDESE